MKPPRKIEKKFIKIPQMSFKLGPELEKSRFSFFYLREMMTFVSLKLSRLQNGKQKELFSGLNGCQHGGD